MPENAKEAKGSSGLRGKLGLPRAVRLLTEIGAMGQRICVTPWFFALLAAGVIVVLFLPVASNPWQSLKIGDVALRDIEAAQELLVVDETGTEEKLNQALRRVKPIYDFNTETLTQLQEKVVRAFRNMRELFTEDDARGGAETAGTAVASAISRDAIVRNTPAAGLSESTPVMFKNEDQSDTASPLGETKIDLKKQQFEDLLGVTFSQEDYRVFADRDFRSEDGNRITTLLGRVMRSGVVSDLSLLLKWEKTGIIVRKTDTGEETEILDVASIENVLKVRKRLDDLARDLAPTASPRFQKAAAALAGAIIQPNLTFNQADTARAREKATQAVSPVEFRVKKGEMIVRRGERMAEKHIPIFAALERAVHRGRAYLLATGTVLLAFSIVVFPVLFTRREIAKLHLTRVDFIFLCTIFILNLIFNQIAISVIAAVSERSTSIPFEAFYFLVPIASGPILVCYFLRRTDLAVLFALVTSAFFGLLRDANFYFFVYAFLGGLAGISMIRGLHRRTLFLRVGAMVALVNTLTIPCIALAMGEMDPVSILIKLALGAAGGVITAIVVLGISPLLEIIFGYTTNLKLLDLADLNQPILRELFLKAPGTYHHSLVMGSMVETVAEEIGANPLVARVAAYYHDIGKLSKPQYFIENQQHGHNLHDKLSPRMSALILASHLKDGTEKAQKHRLGKPIVDIIRQHHGTNLMQYFYQKAVDQAKQAKPGLDTVDEEDFHYPGPRPQTKEAGLIMLADAAEAAVRTIKDPTPARVQGAVQKIINRYFAEGELDECELTLRELNVIAGLYTRFLIGIHHNRVEYPEPAAKEKAPAKNGNETADREPASQGKGKPREGRESRRDNIRRLGMSRG